MCPLCLATGVALAAASATTTGGISALALRMARRGRRELRDQHPEGNSSNEEAMMSTANRSRFVYITFIRTTPGKLWEALTEAKIFRKYWFDTTLDCDWKQGSRWRLLFP